MKYSSLAPIGALFFLGLILLINSAYVIDQTQQVVITQFGEPIGRPIDKPGLHFKTPFIQNANYFDKRILQWDGYPNEIPTQDKKFIWIDLTARWRIVDALEFLRTMGNEINAQSRLDDIIDGIARDAISRNRLVELVRETNRILDAPRTEEGISADVELEKVTVGRNAITRVVVEKTKAAVKDYGIEIIDVQIKRINYVDRVRQKVFERMISERKRAAEKLRSEGFGVRAEIEGQKKKEVKRLSSEAYRKSQELKGQADAEATQVYAESYNKDPEFFSFMSTLETYRRTIGTDSTLILSTDSDYLKYLKNTTKN